MRQDLGAVMAMVALGGGCAVDGPVESDGVAEAVPRSAPAAAMAAGGEARIHVGGICSQHFADPGSKGGGALGHWAGVASVDAWVDQRASMGQAVADLSKTLDRQCRGDAWCYVYAYSNGGAVVSRTLAQQDAERWNILWVFTTASNEGGSELSGGLGAQAAAGLGPRCGPGARDSPRGHRARWEPHGTPGARVHGSWGSAATSRRGSRRAITAPAGTTTTPRATSSTGSGAPTSGGTRVASPTSSAGTPTTAPWPFTRAQGSTTPTRCPTTTPGSATRPRPTTTTTASPIVATVTTSITTR